MSAGVDDLFVFKRVEGWVQLVLYCSNDTPFPHSTLPQRACVWPTYHPSTGVTYHRFVIPILRIYDRWHCFDSIVNRKISTLLEGGRYKIILCAEFAGECQYPVLAPPNLSQNKYSIILRSFIGILESSRAGSVATKFWLAWESTIKDCLSGINTCPLIFLTLLPQW